MADDDLLTLRYHKGSDGMKQLNLKCKNASGIFDALEAVFEQYTEDPPSDEEEEERRAKELEAKAHKKHLKETMAGTKKRKGSTARSAEN